MSPSQTVVDQWGGATMLFHRALPMPAMSSSASTNRGTPAPKGAMWRNVAAWSIGELSSKEQAAAVRALVLAHLPDTARIGIWAGAAVERIR